MVLFVSCICLITSSGTTAASTVLDSLGIYETFSNKAVVSGFVDTERTKRSSVIGAAVLTGLRAMKTLLKGSMRIPAHKKHFNYAKYADEYEKIGDYTRTMEDFVSVNPSNVKVYGLPGGNILTIGQVGDRTIYVKKFGILDKPTLEILQKVGRETRSQLIIYTDDILKKL